MDFEEITEADPGQADRLRPLLDAARSRDRHDPLGEHKWLDLVRDGRGFVGIVAIDGEPIGYAHLSRHGEGWGLEIVVHPQRRNEGLEEQLAQMALRKAAELDGGRLHLWVFQPTEVHDELTKRLGFRHGRDLLHLRVPLPMEREPKFPTGVRLRTFEPGRDEQAWLEVNNRAFADHPEQGAWDIETLERRKKERWFDARDFLLAVDDAGIAGFCWTKVDPDKDCGEIYVIGVDPSRQGSGLGKALTLAGLQNMTRKKVREGCLYVDAAQETPLEMYRSLGFEVDHVDRAYVTDVAAG